MHAARQACLAHLNVNTPEILSSLFFSEDFGIAGIPRRRDAANATNKNIVIRARSNLTRTHLALGAIFFSAVRGRRWHDCFAVE